MSTFNIYQKLEYAVILADSLGHRSMPGGSMAPLLAPKLVHVAPCVYAAHAGMWQPALAMLHKVHKLLTRGRARLSHEQLCAELTDIGQETLAEYKVKLGIDVLDVKVPLVVTGRYRHPADVQVNSATTLLLWETAREFVPTRTQVRASFAVDPEITQVMTSVMESPALGYMLNSGPLSVAQALDAVHALVSRITTFVSREANILVVGSEEEHSLLKGQLIKLPNESLIFG